MKQLHTWPLSMENTRLQPSSDKTYVATWPCSFEHSTSMADSFILNLHCLQSALKHLGHGYN